MTHHNSSVEQRPLSYSQLTAEQSSPPRQSIHITTKVEMWIQTTGLSLTQRRGLVGTPRKRIREPNILSGSRESSTMRVKLSRLAQVKCRSAAGASWV